MIDLKETKERIIDELHDSVSYMEKAVEHKADEWGQYFCMISKNETEHANILLKMFNRTEKPSSVTDTAYLEMHKEIMDAYTDSMTKIESLKKMYSCF